MTLVESGGGGAAVPNSLCPHFGTCGGCAAQDKDDTAYRQWKRGFVEAALRRAGVEAEVAPLVSVPQASRRRARFFAERRASGVKLGFHARASHDVVDMTACRVLEPGLFALTLPLRKYFGDTLDRGQKGEAEAQTVFGAVDVLIRAPGRLDLERSQGLAEFARKARVARVSWQGLRPRHSSRQRGRGQRRSTPEPAEVVAELQPVTARFGGVGVALPPMAFLQASSAGEAFLTDTVTSALAPAPCVADLYSGAGTFTFPLAASPPDGGRKVAAFDGDGAMIAALAAAARGIALDGRVTGTVRNLSRRPLRREELAEFDGVVLDPPRGGAQAQAQELAASIVPLVVMVSCNPATFARDARILIDGGFTPGPVLPVDQFVWTRHVELVAVFSR